MSHKIMFVFFVCLFLFCLCFTGIRYVVCIVEAIPDLLGNSRGEPNGKILSVNCIK